MVTTLSGISMLGLRTGVITKLPHNEIGKFIKHKIRFSGTSDDYVSYDDSPDMRLGIYYYESGAYPRLPVVSYDRRGSSFTRYTIDDLKPSAYEKTEIFHTSGITLALSESLREEAIKIMQKFREAGAELKAKAEEKYRIEAAEQAEVLEGRKATLRAQAEGKLAKASALIVERIVNN